MRSNSILAQPKLMSGEAPLLEVLSVACTGNRKQQNCVGPRFESVMFMRLHTVKISVSSSARASLRGLYKLLHDCLAQPLQSLTANRMCHKQTSAYVLTSCA